MQTLNVEQGVFTAQRSVQPAGLVGNTLRIAVVSDAMPERNGVGSYYKDLVEQLRPKVEHISVIAPSSTDPSLDERFSLRMPGDRSQKIVFPRQGKLQQRIECLRPTVLVIPTIGPYALAALGVARRLRIPVCAALHTNLERLVEIYWRGTIAAPCRWLLQGITNRMIRAADCVATMNVESLKDVQSRGATRVMMVGTPIATSFLIEPVKPLRLKSPRLLFLGRLAREKGIERLLRAAGQLPDMEFLVAGDGPLRSTVQRAAASLHNLKYRGWLDRSAVRATIDDSDILVLPSEEETFGTVALEAMSRRRIVVVTEECGIRQWPELTGGLISVRRSEDLALALRQLTELTIEKQESIADAGWRAIADFNESTISGWIALLTSLDV